MTQIFEVKFACDVDPGFLRRIWTYTAAVKTEVSALGEVIWNPETRVLTVPDELHMFKQKAHVAGVHLDIDEVADFTLSMAEKGIPTNKFGLWWHTHGSMEAFFSLTDDTTINELSSEFFDKIFLAVVTNDRGDSRWRAVIEGKTIEWVHRITITPPSVNELNDAKVLLEKYIEEEPFFRGLKKGGSTFKGWGGFRGYRR